MRETSLCRIGSRVLQLLQVCQSVLDDREPADPLIFILTRPKRGITAPKPGHFVAGLPIIESCLHRLCQRRGELPAGQLDARFGAHWFLFFCSTTESSFWNASAKSLMASSRSWFVTFCIEMPVFSRLAIVSSAASKSASSVRRTTP